MDTGQLVKGFSEGCSGVGGKLYSDNEGIACAIGSGNFARIDIGGKVSLAGELSNTLVNIDNPQSIKFNKREEMMEIVSGCGAIGINEDGFINIVL